MLGEFETVEIGGERLVRVRLFDSRYGVANLHGRRWPSCAFDEVMTEAVALRLSFDLWRDTLPCWMEKVDKEVADELARYQNQVGRELTREEVEEIHESPQRCTAGFVGAKKHMITTPNVYVHGAGY